ncbi:MAG: hypothetical protein AAF532_03665 [Planctomycetota bacterium]
MSDVSLITKVRVNLPCEFGSVTFNKKGIGVGVSAAREHIDIAKCETLLVQRRLRGRFELRKEAAPTLPGFDDVDFYADVKAGVKAFKVSEDGVGFRVRLEHGSIEPIDVLRFRNRAGAFVITGHEYWVES